MGTNKRAEENKPLPEDANDLVDVINVSGFDPEAVWAQFTAFHKEQVNRKNLKRVIEYALKHTNWVRSYVQAGKLMEKAIRLYGPVPEVPTALRSVVSPPGNEDRFARIEDTGKPLTEPRPIPQRYSPPPNTVFFGPRVEGWEPEAYYATEKTTVEVGDEAPYRGKTFVLKVMGKLGSHFYFKRWELKKK
jgi:hypothetical protein